MRGRHSSLFKQIMSQKDQSQQDPRFPPIAWWLLRWCWRVVIHSILGWVIICKEGWSRYRWMTRRAPTGFKPTKKDKQQVAAQKRVNKLAKLEGRTPVSRGLGKMPPLSITFPKAAFIPQPEIQISAEDKPVQAQAPEKKSNWISSLWPKQRSPVIWKK